MERRWAISFCFHEVPVNKNENDGIKLNGIIVAINQATGEQHLQSHPYGRLFAQPLDVDAVREEG